MHVRALPLLDLCPPFLISPVLYVAGRIPVGKTIHAIGMIAAQYMVCGLGGAPRGGGIWLRLPLRRSRPSVCERLQCLAERNQLLSFEQRYRNIETYLVWSTLQHRYCRTPHHCGRYTSVKTGVLQPGQYRKDQSAMLMISTTIFPASGRKRTEVESLLL
jgi:hypothetical protein